MYPHFKYPPLAKPLFVLALLLMMALRSTDRTLVTPALATNGTMVKVDPSTAVLHSSQTATINVRIENANDLVGAEVHMLYNPAVLEVQMLEAGEIPAPDFIVQSNFGEGRIDYAVAQMPNQHPAANGSGIMLRVTFHARGNGSSTLDLGDVILADARGKPIPMITQDGEIYVNLETPASPPAAPPNSPDAFQPIRSFLERLLNFFGVSK